MQKIDYCHAGMMRLLHILFVVTLASTIFLTSAKSSSTLCPLFSQKSKKTESHREREKESPICNPNRNLNLTNAFCEHKIKT